VSLRAGQLGSALRAAVSASALAFAVAACKSAPLEPAPAAPAPSVAPAPTAPNAPNAPSAPSVDAPSNDSAAASPRCVEPLGPEPARDPRPVTDARCPREPGPPRRFAKRPLLVGRERLTVELARTEAEREQGLMYRRALAEGEGMLFDLGAVGRHAFWMHDTCVPLDIGFLDEDGVLVGVAEKSPPLDDAPRAVRCPSRYVLEVPSGWYRRRGVLPGARIDLAGQ